MTIGNKIKSLRLEKQMTQEQLANELHVTRNAVSKWETDKGLPNIDSLIMLAKTFNVSLDYLIGQEEILEMTIENRKKLELNKNLLYGIILFFLFSLIGTLVPYLFYRTEPSSVMVAMIIILPILYLLLGIVSVLVLSTTAYVSIAAALAVTPIYVFFDLFIPHSTLGLLGILYFIIFLLTHIILSRVLRNNRKFNVNNLKILFLVITIGIILIFIIHTVYETIKLVNCTWCSAAYYTPLVVNILIYIIPFTLSFTLFLYFYKQSKLIERGDI